MSAMSDSHCWFIVINPASGGGTSNELVSGAGRDVDLGVAVDASGRRRYIHNVAGAGLDAEVVRRAPAGGPRPLACLARLARTLAGFRAPQFSATVDGRAQSGKFWPVLAANGPCCDGGMQLAPGARLVDGWLDLVTVAPLGAGAALANPPDCSMAGFRAIRHSPSLAAGRR